MGWHKPTFPKQKKHTLFDGSCHIADDQTVQTATKESEDPYFFQASHTNQEKREDGFYRSDHKVIILLYERK